MAERTPNRYTLLIERIFSANYHDGAEEVDFTREQLVATANELGIELPKNIGDVVYSFRYRVDLPQSITETAPVGLHWVILPVGRAQYRFVLRRLNVIVPTTGMAETKVPDATPGIITMYAFTDEQALLAKLRYNRLIDIFTGVTCYSLQSHFRTTVTGRGQVETDEMYVGIDRRGAQYVFPVQAKGGADRLSTVQIFQDFQIGAEKFPNLICRPIAAQFTTNNVIALFDFEMEGDEVKIVTERHFRLVSPDELSPEDLERYRTRTDL